jgi:hypothetical protein
VHEQRASLLAAEAELAHGLAHPREVGVVEVVENHQRAWCER